MLKDVGRAFSCISNKYPQATRNSSKFNVLDLMYCMKYHKSQFLCVLGHFGHEGVNIWKCSRVTARHPPVFWRGTPKLQETATKKTYTDKTRFNTMAPGLGHQISKITLKMTLTMTFQGQNYPELSKQHQKWIPQLTISQNWGITCVYTLRNKKVIFSP